MGKCFKIWYESGTPSDSFFLCIHVDLKKTMLGMGFFCMSSHIVLKEKSLASN